MKFKRFTFLLKTLSILLLCNIQMMDYCRAQCIPVNNCTGENFIQSFSTTGGITNITSNNTGCAATGYTFYSNMECTQQAGQNFLFSFDNDNFHDAYMKIWVDWNANNAFTDPGEEVFAPPFSIAPSTNIAGPITIPAGTTPGIKRLRIRLSAVYGPTNNLTPCSPSSTPQIGETEDYLVNVLPNACNGTPPTATTLTTASNVSCNGTTKLSLQGNSTSTNLSYQWQYNTMGTWINFGANADTQRTPGITQTTQFRCVVSCPNPTVSSATSIPVLVSVNLPVVNLGNDTTVCPGATQTLVADNGGNTYLWSNGATTQTITVNAVGLYSVKITYPGGCFKSDSILITPGMAPVNNLNDTTNYCMGSSITLNAGNAGASFLWMPGGQTTPSKTITTEGQYNVSIKSHDGCSIVSNTYVKARAMPIPNLGNDTTLCSSAAFILDAGNAGASYTWNTGANSQTIIPTDSGTYQVTTTTAYNCSITEQVHIGYLPVPSIEGFNFIPQFFNAIGQVKFSPLVPDNVDRYEWDFGDNTPLSNQMNPTHTYATAGAYNVTLRVYNECGSTTKSLVINVDLTTGIVTANDDQAEIVLYPNPSADIITIENKTANVKMKHINIYNMLGALIYTADADSFKKHQLSTRAFASAVYSMQIQLNNGIVSKKIEVIH